MDKRMIVIINAAYGLGVFFLAVFGAFVALVIIGTMFETVAMRQDELRHCQKQAVTPYEYHQCR